MYKKILVAIDDSATSRTALAEAIHIARTSNAKLYITHVVDEILLNMHGHAKLDMGSSDDAAVSLSAAGKQLLANALQEANGIDAEAILLEAFKRGIAENINEKAKNWA